MILELWYDPEAKTNELEKILNKLKRIDNEENSEVNVMYVDATEMSEGERKNFYFNIILNFVHSHAEGSYKVASELRGSKEDFRIGIRRPMLLVWEREEVQGSKASPTSEKEIVEKIRKKAMQEDPESGVRFDGMDLVDVLKDVMKDVYPHSKSGEIEHPLAERGVAKSYTILDYLDTLKT